ncbi:hypothetical protein [Serratia fonticola]|uniref:hypothetical protein n=1 Tax=Serratia fonticola TaxID=47917 RepID=UPI003AAAE29A
MTTPSQVPVPSEKPQDLLFNAGKIDEFVNSVINQYIDRFGAAHLTIAGITALARTVIEQIKADGAEAVSAIGWQELGDWALNLTINNRDQVVWYDNAWYKYIGELPHTIAGDSPESDGGIWSDENPDGKWVNIGDAALRGALASHDAGRGASLIALTQGGTVQNAITYVTPEMFGAKADLSTDDTSAIASAIAYAGGNPTKGVFFGQKYKINNSANFDVPSGVSVFGAGSESGVVMEGVPVGSLHVIFNLAGKGSCLRDFAIEFTTDGAGSIGAVKTFGVMLQSTSSFCQVYGLKINGKKIGAMGFSHGIRCTGYKNKISNNDIQYCTMGITYRGTGHYITYNYTNNHYLTDGARPWTSASPYWDGITGEGAINCTVAFNTCEENGQSGIYLGGNNSLSYDVIICNNTLRRNWNRGIDTGVSGTPSSINNVLNITISCNNSSDNREPQIWLSGTSNSVVTGNVAKLTDEYNIIFAGFFGASRIGIALNDTDNCKNNIIESNFISTTTSDLFGVTVNGIGHIYRNNRLVGKGDFLSNSVANRLIYNDIGRVVSSFSPQVVSGSGVTVVSSSGAYSIDGQRLFFQISMSLTATSPSGSLVIGYLPGLSSASVLQSNVSIQSYNGFSTSMPGSLEAHQNLDVPDTIFITRTGSGRQNYDVASYVGSNSTILISGSVLVARGF